MYKNKKTEISNWLMFSDEGNRQIDQIVKRANKQKLTWPEVFKELWLLHKQPAFYEAMDQEVARGVYENLKYTSPYYFYGLTVNGKTLFDVFPDLQSK